MRPWVWLAAGIITYDVYLIRHNRPTLSTEFARMVRHPIHRWPTVLAWSYVTVHLLGVLNDRDPLQRVARLLIPRGQKGYII